MQQKALMIWIHSNHWLSPGQDSNNPAPMLMEADFWQGLLKPVMIERSPQPTVIEFLTTARLFAPDIDKLMGELIGSCTYEKWITRLLSTPPAESNHSTLVLGWQPVFGPRGILEWYSASLLPRTGPHPLGLPPTYTLNDQVSTEELLDLRLAIDSVYSVYNANGIEVFFTRKPFTLLDLICALLETLFFVDGPNERSTYVQLAREQLRHRYEQAPLLRNPLRYE